MGKLASRLLLSRRDMHWDQAELAAKSGVSRQYISDLERGRITNPGIEMIEALAKALGIQPSHLAGWTDDPLGEDLPANMHEGRIVYQASSQEDYRRIQELLDLFNDLAPEYQAMALHMINEFKRVQNVRIVGGE